MTIHIAIASQIEFPLRIVIPAYVVGVACLTIVLKNMLSQLNKRIKTIFTCAVLLASIAIVTARFVLAISYSQKIQPVLDYIKSYPQYTLCIPKESIASPTIPAIYLGQEPILADWAMPETIYGKTITFCN